MLVVAYLAVFNLTTEAAILMVEIFLAYCNAPKE
jgi:hypothetical protein